MSIKLLKESNSDSKLREMTKNDMMGYQGAEDLPSGKGPLIASGETADVIVSGDEDYPGSALVYIVFTEDDYMTSEYVNDDYLTEEEAISLGNRLARYVDSKPNVIEMIAKRLKLRKN